METQLLIFKDDYDYVVQAAETCDSTPAVACWQAMVTWRNAIRREEKVKGRGEEHEDGTVRRRSICWELGSVVQACSVGGGHHAIMSRAPPVRVSTQASRRTRLLGRERAHASERAIIRENEDVRGAVGERDVRPRCRCARQMHAWLRDALHDFIFRRIEYRNYQISSHIGVLGVHDGCSK